MALRWHDSIMILTDAVLFVFFFVSFRGTRVLIPLETKTLSFSNFVLKKMLSLLDPRKWKFLQFCQRFFEAHTHAQPIYCPFYCQSELWSLARSPAPPSPPPPHRPALQFCPEWEVSVNVDLREGWVTSYPKTSIDPFSVCGFKWKLPFSTFLWYLLYAVYGGSNFSVCEQNLIVWPFKWKLLG